MAAHGPVPGSVPILELQSVSKTFRRRGGGGAHKAVDDATLTVHQGETVALVGESGSGKSTLARMALALLRPDSGEVRLQGHALNTLPAAELRHVRTAMQPVFQDSGAAFNPRRTVLQLLAQATDGSRDGPALAAHLVQLLEKVGLRPGGDFLNRFPHELSGGQRQRLAIARAIAMDPVLIIADEPLSGADVSIRGQILNLLKDLQTERGVAYLFVTHDISLARSFAHRVAVMYQGAIVEQGDARQVIGSPSHPYTRRLVSAALTLDHSGAVAIGFGLPEPPAQEAAAETPGETETATLRGGWQWRFSIR